MSIKIDDPDLHTKIAEVGSAPWFAEDAAEMTGQFTIKRARAAYAENLKRIEDEQDPEWKAELARRKVLGIMIYGPSGLHRYFVRADGTVWFSAHHGLSSVAKAVEAGFDVQQ